MDVRLLGGVECWCDGEPISVHGRSARAVLAMLALDRGRVVSRDQLVEGLWGEGLPDDPSAAVYVTLSRVRLALGSDRDRLRRVGHGYVLDATDDEVDVGRAERALARGRALLTADQAEAAKAVLEAGLAEWRGETPLADLYDLPFAPLAASRLQELRTELVETANRASLACGKPEEVVVRTEEALRHDPWREQLVAQLMTALYQSGRQGDALAVYVRLASALQAEFGAIPSPELQDLRARIMDHAPALKPAPAPDRAAVESLPAWFKVALEDLDPGEDDPVLRCRVTLALGHAEHNAGLPTWRETLLSAADLALAIGDPSLVAQAVLGGALGWSVTPGAPDARRVRLMKFALGHGDQLDDDLRVRLLGAYADELAFTATLDERIELTDRAVARARASGRPRLLVQALNHRFNAIWAPQTLTTRRRDAAEACRLAEQGDHRRDRILAHGYAMAAAVEAADMDEADRHLEAFTGLADRLGLAVFQWGARAHQVWRQAVAGDQDRAEELAEQAWHFGVDHGRPEAGIVHATQRAAVRWIQGRLAEEAEALNRLSAACPGLPALVALQALAILHTGRAEEARRLLREAWKSGTITELPADQNCLAAGVHWAEVAAATGEAPAASALYASLIPYADRLAYNGTSVYGPVAHALGLLAAALGDEEQAQAHFHQAHRVAVGVRSPPFAGRAAQELQRLEDRTRTG